MFNLGFQMKLAATRIYYSFGGFGIHRANIGVSQEMTRRPNSPVRVYSTIGEVTDATSKLTWTEDPWLGKLDVIKHPTFMQEAIDKHPDYSGDCDDQAAYWVCALRKSKLNDNAFLAFALWEEKSELAGHACCVFMSEGSWWWVSNWHKCVPQKINDAYGWMGDMSATVKKPILAAGRILIDGVCADDTLVIGQALRCK